MTVPSNRLLPHDMADDDASGLLRKDMALQGLTGQQEMFCKLMFNGLSATDAYRQAYHCENAAPQTVSQMATRAKLMPKVVARMEQLQARWEHRASLDSLIRRDEIARGIAGIAFDQTNKTSDRLKAYELLGKIGGIDLFKQGSGDKPAEELPLEEVEQLLARRLAALKDVTPSK